MPNQDSDQKARDSQGVISDLTARLHRLERKVTPEPSPAQVSPWSITFLSSPVDLVSTAPSGSTQFADTGSSKYIPSSARYAYIQVSIEDTTLASGQSTIDGRGNGVTTQLLSLYEPGAAHVGQTCSNAFMPVNGGRFDWRVTTPGGGASRVRITLLGYII